MDPKIIQEDAQREPGIALLVNSTSKATGATNDVLKPAHKMRQHQQLNGSHPGISEGAREGMVVPKSLESFMDGIDAILKNSGHNATDPEKLGHLLDALDLDKLVDLQKDNQTFSAVLTDTISRKGNQHRHSTISAGEGPCSLRELGRNFSGARDTKTKAKERART